MKTRNSLFTLVVILVFLLLCLVPSGNAQQQCVPAPAPPSVLWQVGIACTFTASSPSTGAFTAKGIAYWKIFAVPSGTISGATLSLDSSTNGSSWSTGGVIASATIGALTSPTLYQNATATTPTLFFQLTPTITGSGTLQVMLYGYTDSPNSSGGATSNVNVTNASVPVSLSAPLPAGSNAIGAVSVNSLPASVASAANQTNVQGAAGAPSSTAITVQGNASGTPVAVNGTVSTQPAGFSSIVNGQQSVTTSAAALSSNSVHGFCVHAAATNAGIVYVGGSGVTTSTGYPLAGGESICYQASNTNLAYVIAAATGNSVAFSGN